MMENTLSTSALLGGIENIVEITLRSASEFEFFWKKLAPNMSHLFHPLLKLTGWSIHLLNNRKVHYVYFIPR